MAQLVYMVCDTDHWDASTATCTQVQVIQAPNLIPPLSISDAVAIAVPMMGLWVLAAVYGRL